MLDSRTSGFKSWLKSFFIRKNDEAETRGEDSEARVFKVIEEMLIWRELPTYKKGTRPYRTLKWSELDRKGVDIVVPTKRGDIYIQVKSSSYGWTRFVQNKRSRDKICINGQKTEVQIIKELRFKLRIAYDRLRPLP